MRAWLYAFIGHVLLQAFDRFTHGIAAFDLDNAIVTSQRQARQNGPRQRRT